MRIVRGEWRRTPAKKEKATPFGVAPFFTEFWWRPSGDAFFTPVPDAQDFLHLAAFVTVLFSFLGTVGDFAEGVLRIPNNF
jgi:hypothetical protein